MARVTASEVEAIIDIDSYIDVDAFISIATNFVDDEFADHYSTTRLKDLEIVLTAHFIAHQQRQLEQEWIGDAKQYFSGKFGKGWEFTQYGQMLLSLDTEGILLAVSKPLMTLTAL